MSKYPILQSGFIGFDEAAFNKPLPTEPSFRLAIVFKDIRNPLNKFFYSEDVKDLFNAWTSDFDKMKSMEFREKILKAAFKCFGTSNFFEWLALQSKQPTITDLHRAFILETLDYLLLQSPRKISVTSWARMIEAAQRADTVTIDVTKYFKKDYGSSDSDNVRIPVRISEVIQLWTSKPDGFDDLLYSLYIIFGDRLAHTAITSETT